MQKFYVYLFTTFLLLWGNLSWAQLSGAYTIDKNLTASSTNYQSFADAFSDLQQGVRSDGGKSNGPGVSGPVTVTVDTGRYEENITIESITGASSTNWISVIGQGINQTSLTGDPLTSKRHIIGFQNNASYVRFEHMTISNRSLSTIQEIIAPNQSNNLQFINCKIEALENPEYYTGRLIGGNSCIVVRNSDKVRFDSCVMLDTGGANIQCYTSDQLEVTHCTMKLASYRPLTIFGWGSYAPVSQIMSPAYIFSSTDLIFEQNDIEVYPAVNPMAMPWKLQFGSCKSINRAVLIRNNRLLTPGPGILVNLGIGKPGKEIEICGNEVICYDATDTESPIEVTGAEYGKIYHNSVIRTGAKTANHISGGGITVTNSKHWDIKNNVIINEGYKACANIASSSDVNLDYNLYWNLDNQDNSLVRIDDQVYGLDSLQQAHVGGVNSYYGNPQIKGNRDLSSNGNCFIGDSLDVGKDRLDQLRNSWPKIGAFASGSVSSFDIALQNIRSPENQISDSTQTVSVVVANIGQTQLDSITLNYSINDGKVIQQKWYPGNLDTACEQSVMHFKTNGNFTGCSKLKVWLSNPNGKLDDNQLNDTLYRFIGRPIASGSYSVGPTNADYISFQSVIDALNCAGIQGDGDVEFVIDSGFYEEQLVLNKILNSDQKSRIIFRSKTGNKNDVKLAVASAQIKSQSGRPVLDQGLLSVVKVTGMSHLTFRDITFEALDSTWNSLFYVAEDCEDIRLSNCGFRIPEAPIYYQVNNLISFKPGLTLSNITIDSCIFNGGYKQVDVYQVNVSDSLKIANSTFIPTNTYHGVSIWQSNKVAVANNTFKHENGNTYITIEANFSINTSIYNNIIQGVDLYSGIRVANGSDQKVYNNMVSNYVTNDASDHFGINLMAVSRIEVSHNSIAVKTSPEHDGNISNKYRCAALQTTNNGSNDIKIRNNIFSLQAAKTSNNVAVQQAWASVPNIVFDHNIYYSNSYYHEFNKQYHTPGSSVTGLNSRIRYPFFKSFWDLHLNPGRCSGVQGSKTLGIIKDIDDSTRTLYHIGADEVDTSAVAYDVMSLEIFEPGLVVPHLSQNDISFSLTNVSLNNLNSVQVGYEAGDSVVSKTHYFSTPLVPCKMDTVTFSHYFDSIRPETITTYTGIINTTKSDQNTTNDTLIKTVSVDRLNDAELRTIYTYNTSLKEDTLTLFQDSLFATAFVQNPVKYPLNERFRVQARIVNMETGQLVWTDNEFLDSIEGFDSRLVDFKVFAALNPGPFRLTCYVEYPGDKYSFNDTTTYDFYVETNNDLLLAEILIPASDLPAEENEGFNPKIRIKNQGINDQEFPFTVHFSIEKNGITVYNEQATIDSLNAGKELVYSWSKQYTPDTSMRFDVIAEVKTLLDDFPKNNIARSTFEVSRKYDVGIERVNSPQQDDVIARTSNTIPEISLINTGRERCDTVVTTYIITNETLTEVYKAKDTASINPNETKQITFEKYTASDKGTFQVVAYTNHRFDNYSDNDTSYSRFVVKDKQDVAPVELIAPKENAVIAFNNPIVPLQARIKNVGVDDVTNFFFTKIEVLLDKQLVHKDSIVVIGLDTDADKLLSFNAFSPSKVGNYVIRVTTRLKNDGDQGNDTFESQFQVRDSFDVAALDWDQTDLYKRYQTNIESVNLFTSFKHIGIDNLSDSCEVQLNILRNGAVEEFQSKKILPELDDENIVQWTSFLPDEIGTYSLVASCHCDQDNNQNNDTLRGSFVAVANTDASVEQISKPANNVTYLPKDTVYIEANIRNRSILDQQVPVEMRIYRNSQVQPVHQQSLTVAIDSLQAVGQTFNSFVVTQSGNYRIEIYTQLVNDQIPQNDTAIVYFNVDKTNHISSYDNTDIMVYPNPSADGVFVVSGNTLVQPGQRTFQVLNSLGQQVFVQNISGNENVEIDLSHLVDGIYYLEITDTDNRIHFTLLKM